MGCRDRAVCAVCADWPYRFFSTVALISRLSYELQCQEEKIGPHAAGRSALLPLLSCTAIGTESLENLIVIFGFCMEMLCFSSECSVETNLRHSPCNACLVLIRLNEVVVTVVDHHALPILMLR